jgi:hypothetical protein
MGHPGLRSRYWVEQRGGVEIGDALRRALVVRVTENDGQLPLFLGEGEKLRLGDGQAQGEKRREFADPGLADTELNGVRRRVEPGCQHEDALKKDHRDLLLGLGLVHHGEDVDVVARANQRDARGLLVHLDGNGTTPRLNEGAEVPSVLVGRDEVGPHERLLRLDRVPHAEPEDLLLFDVLDRAILDVCERNLTRREHFLGDHLAVLDGFDGDDQLDFLAARRLRHETLLVEHEKNDAEDCERECNEECAAVHARKRRYLGTDDWGRRDELGPPSDLSRSSLASRRQGSFTCRYAVQSVPTRIAGPMRNHETVSRSSSRCRLFGRNGFTMM